MIKTGVLRNVENSKIYLYLGNDNYQNLVSGAEGIIAPDLAGKILKINVEATYFYLNYPEQFTNLVKSLKLKFDK